MQYSPNLQAIKTTILISGPRELDTVFFSTPIQSLVTRSGDLNSLQWSGVGWEFGWTYRHVGVVFFSALNVLYIMVLGIMILYSTSICALRWSQVGGGKSPAPCMSGGP